MPAPTQCSHSHHRSETYSIPQSLDFLFVNNFVNITFLYTLLLFSFAILWNPHFFCVESADFKATHLVENIFVYRSYMCRRLGQFNYYFFHSGFVFSGQISRGKHCVSFHCQTGRNYVHITNECCVTTCAVFYLEFRS